MSKPDDGGPAFPVSRGHFAPDGKMLSADWMPGMSLRDWFAGQALAGIAANTAVVAALAKRPQDEPMHFGFAALAYETADAMIAERQKGGSDGS